MRVQEGHEFAAHSRCQMNTFRPHVLVVDDASSMRQLILREFDGLNVTTEEAANGVEALQRVRQRRPDLITLDIEMPNLDGYGFCRFLSSTPDTAGIPVLMISSQEGNEHRLRALEAGAVEYFVKPFEAGALRRLAQVLFCSIKTNRTRTIYSIDHDPEVRRYLKDALAKHGYSHRGFAEVGALIAALEREPCDLLLLDFKLPEQGTYRILDAIKKLPAERSVRVVASMVDNARRDLLNAFYSGACDFVRKPFFVEELVARIERQFRVQSEERQLRELATIDPLTRLVNRGEITRLAQVEIARARRERLALGVLVLDLDHFKHLNDSYGHPFGDQVLREVAEALKSEVRATDLVGRYGGEEFLVILPRATPTGLVFIAERLRRAVANLQLEIAQEPVAVTISAGARLWAPDALRPNMTLGEFIEQADQALYRAKETGRNRVVAWNEGEFEATVPAR